MLACGVWVAGTSGTGGGVSQDALRAADRLNLVVPLLAKPFVPGILGSEAGCKGKVTLAHGNVGSDETVILNKAAFTPAKSEV